VLEMYRFDPNADDTSRDNLMRQSIDLISKFPTIIAYAFNMLRIHNWRSKESPL
jgi:citrate synthase